MTITVLFAISAAALLAGLVRTVREDGYGHRRPPASFAPWTNGHLQSTPPALG